MNERANPGERNGKAIQLRDLLLECRDKVSKDCPEPTLILSDGTICVYARELEGTAWTSRKGLTSYRQVVSDLVERITLIRDDLPDDWQDFSNWLGECTRYPDAATSKASPTRSLPHPSNPLVQTTPIRNGSISFGVPSAIQTPSAAVVHNNIDPAPLAVDGANSKDTMDIDIDPVSTGVQKSASQVSPTNVNTVSPISNRLSPTPQARETDNNMSSAVSGGSHGDTVMHSVVAGSDTLAQNVTVAPEQKADVSSKSLGSHADGTSIFKLPGIAASFQGPASFTFHSKLSAENVAQSGKTFSLSTPKPNPAIDEKSVPLANAFAFGSPDRPATISPFVGPDGGSIFGNLDAKAKTADKPFSSVLAIPPERKMAPLKSRSSLLKTKSAGKALSPTPKSKPILDFSASSASFEASSAPVPSISSEPAEKKSRHTSPSSSSSPPSCATKGGSPPKADLSPAPSLVFTTSKTASTQTDPMLSSIQDGALERISSLLEEERAARIEADTKRVDAEMKQKQAHEELAERETAVSKRESELSEREKAQGEKEKAFANKVQAVFATIKQLQMKADRMQNGAEARLGKAMTPVNSATKQEEPVDATVLTSTAGANDKVLSEAKKTANPKHKSMRKIVKTIKKDLPPGKAHIVFGDLKHGALRISGLRKAQRDNLQTQVEKVLSAYEEVPASTRKQHASMLIDLINFGAAISRNNERYLLLDATVKDAAIAFADECLANHLLQDNNWIKFNAVSQHHKFMQAIETIKRLGTSLSDMNLALRSIEEPDEFDDKDNAATPSEILRNHYNMFSEYEAALDLILHVVPKSSPVYAPLEAYRTREVAAMYDAWTEAARTFDYTA